MRSDFKHQLGLPEKVKLLGIDRLLPVPKGMHWEQINCLASFTREARDPFAEPGGLYSAEEVDGADGQYLKEWSILTGTPPAFLLTPREASPPASAASSAHARLLPSPGIAEAAMQGVEALLRGSIRACLGRAMSAVEQFILTLCLCAGNLYAVCMLANRLVSMVAHLCGCFGKGSQQTWQEGLQWACCGTVKLAAVARRGFQPPPPPPVPSAPPPLVPGEEGESMVPEGPSRPFLTKWKGSQEVQGSSSSPSRVLGDLPHRPLETPPLGPP